MRCTIPILLAVVVTSVNARAQSSMLAGAWKLDPARSQGIPPGFQMALTIRESGDSVLIDNRVQTPQTTVVLSDTIFLTGVEFPYTFRRPNGQEGRGKRTARRTNVGLALSDSVSIDTPIGPAPRATAATWTVDPAARTLTQEITVTQQFFVTPVKYVFVRGEP